MILSERFVRGVLIVWALAALAVGLMALLLDLDVAGNWIWAAGTVPVIAALGVSITRDLAARRMGVDAVALISMTAALILNANLAAVVVAVMYAGGTVLEDFAVARAERDLRSPADRAPRIAHRRRDDAVEDIAVDAVRQGDVVLVTAGEIVPVDGVLLSTSAALDESALTGEPLPSIHCAGDGLRSGAVNAGETFEMMIPE